jgi:TolA-binding protein
MLTPKKKITKKELKEDTLVTTYAKATTYYADNKKNISIVVTVVAIVVIALIVYGKNRSDNNISASSAVGEIYSLYDAGQYQQSIDGVPERNIKGLQAIVDAYGNSAAGDIARFYLANAQYHTGKYDQALENFKKFSPNTETLEISRLSGIGCSYEAKGQYSDAAGYFEKAGMKNPKDPNAAENLDNAARNYKLSGNKERATELYKKLKKEYATTQFGRDAERALTQLAM